MAAVAVEGAARLPSFLAKEGTAQLGATLHAAAAAHIGSSILSHACALGQELERLAPARSDNRLGCRCPASDNRAGCRYERLQTALEFLVVARRNPSHPNLGVKG